MEVPRLTAEQAKEKWDRGEAIFIDTRNPDAWAGSKVKLPGALRILGSQVDQRISELPHDRTIIAYCT